MRRPQHFCVLLLVLVVSWTFPLTAVGQSPPAIGRFIAVVVGDASPITVANSHGIGPRHLLHSSNAFAFDTAVAPVERAAAAAFSSCLRFPPAPPVSLPTAVSVCARRSGFPSPTSPLVGLAADPRVQQLIPDLQARAFPPPAGKGPKKGSSTPTNALPTGVNRIDAETTGDYSDLRVAVLDTGIDLDHRNLNVSPDAPAGLSRDFTGKGTADDGNGHGSHVAGTIAAAPTAGGTGVWGVAPRAELVAVKVLDDSGSGSFADIIAGIEYLTALNNQGLSPVQAANMSLGGTLARAGSDLVLFDLLRTALVESVASGTTYAVAAGNDARNIVFACTIVGGGPPRAGTCTMVPAAYGEGTWGIDGLMTVSAVADSDGACGEGGGATKYGADDSFALFSNYGPEVSVAAPGVSILSTYKDNGYEQLSGTSMATPHAAGAVLRYLTAHAGNQPAEIEAGLKGRAIDQNQACVPDTGQGGFLGDPDGSPERLIYVGGLP